LILEVASSAIYGAALLSYRPAPVSLRESGAQSLGERTTQVRGTLALGLVLILIYALGTGASSFSTDDAVLARFGESVSGVLQQGRVYQIVTAIFLHADFFHLLSNLTVLAVLSWYECQHGTARFYFVFIWSAVVDTVIGLAFLSPGVVTMGASAGLFGLVAAYFIDGEIRPKGFGQWAKVGLVIMGLSLIISLSGELTKHELKIDHIGHLLGAAGGIAFCRLWPSKQISAAT
jgi:rhomboid protease GluP